MNEEPQIDLDELAVALRAPGARAPLVVWMIEHHDELAAVLSRTRVNWASFCTYVDKQGFRNGRGQSLSPDNVRQCWKRARAVIARERKAVGRRRLAEGLATRTAGDGDRIFQSRDTPSGNGSAVEPASRVKAARPVPIEPEFDRGEQSDFEIKAVPGRLRGWQPPSAEAAAAREVAELAQRVAKPKRAKDPPNG